VKLRYQVAVKHLVTGNVRRDQQDRFRKYAKAMQHVRDINEHCVRHEAWVETVQADNSLRAQLTWSIPSAMFWGIVGALAGGRRWALALALGGGVYAILAYCLFAVGKRADGQEETRDEEGRKAA
jgi:hypothetical protein